MPRILFVEDELAVTDTLKRFFQREGYDVYIARSLTEALDAYQRHPPDCVVLDVMLNEGPEPDKSGFDVCRALRDQDYDGPVIFVTARTSEQDKLLGFELGADDYVTKPFSLAELKARISAVLRRTGGAKSVYRFRVPSGADALDVEVDLDNYVIRHPDGEERLSNREQELLRYLIEHRGKVLPRGELLTGIWRYSPNVTTRTVDTHILNVRKKLRDDAGSPMFIETLHGVGYRFIAQEGGDHNSGARHGVFRPFHVQPPPTANKFARRRRGSDAHGRAAVIVLLTRFAHAEELDSRIQLYDALLAEVHGDVETAVARYTELSRTLSDEDPTLSESLYWLGHGLYDLGRVDDARQALRDGIRNGTCPRCRDLLGVIDIESAAITTVPVEWTFHDATHGLFHPWRVQELGSIQVAPAPWGDPGLQWTTIARPGEPDRLVVGFREPSPAPESVKFVVVSTDLVAWIDVVAEDDHGRTFALESPIAASRGVARRIAVPFSQLVPTDKGAPLDTRHLVLLSIVDRTASRSSGTNRLWIDDFEVL